MVEISNHRVLGLNAVNCSYTFDGSASLWLPSSAYEFRKSYNEMLTEKLTDDKRASETRNKLFLTCLTMSSYLFLVKKQ